MSVPRVDAPYLPSAGWNPMDSPSAFAKPPMMARLIPGADVASHEHVKSQSLPMSSADLLPAFQLSISIPSRTKNCKITFQNIFTSVFHSFLAAQHRGLLDFPLPAE